LRRTTDERAEAVAGEWADPRHAPWRCLRMPTALQAAARALLSATSASPTGPVRTIAFVTRGQLRLACA
jgi:hypothetical protein